MLAGGIGKLRTLQALGAVKVRNVTGKLIVVTRAGGRVLKIRGVREYSDGRAAEFEELRLARLFHRYLKMFIREKILKLESNRAFTILMKGKDHPLSNTTSMVEKFVYIRKLERGYRVGFNTAARYNEKFTLGTLLEILEKGVRLDKNAIGRRKMQQYIWINIKNKNKKIVGEWGDGGYKIPPRPFFDKIVQRFMTHNKGERREFTKGHYSLHIRVRKPVIRRAAESVRMKEKGGFTELYG